MDVTIKGIPEGITEAQVKEWCAVLVEKFNNQKIDAVPAVIAATEEAKTSIDTFRVANALTAKFAKEEVVEPIGG